MKIKLRRFALYFSKKIIVILFELRARFTSKRFFCRALKGDSKYNTAINSDLTVSCNCNDKYGLGQIGDLRKHNLKEIFSGEKANSFRVSLAKGKLPIVNCLTCADLCPVNKELAGKYIHEFDTPKTIMIENTVNCSLRCLSCERESIYSLRKKREMSLADIEKLSRQIKENNVERVFYHNLGEPFSSVKIKEELGIIRELNPRVSIIVSTNGCLLDLEEKRDAALEFDRIIFSIHGSTQKSAGRYQRGIDFNKAYSNMKALVKKRNSLKRKKPVIIWKYLLFRWNDSEKLLKNAIKLAREANVNQIYFEKTLSPPLGISYRHFLGLGSLNKSGNFKGNIYRIRLEK